MAISKSLYRWRFYLVIIFLYATCNDPCFGAKLERKQDFFDVESFDSKRDYRLNEIGKRGFTSTLGFDYSGSSEYGIGATSVVGSDYSNSRNSENLSPARDLIPPPAPGVYSSSTSPPSTKSDYTKFRRIPFPSSTKAFHSTVGRSQISRRSPHLQHASLNSYFDEISSTTTGSRGRALNSGNYGLVADNDGKLIGYRGSILPGYTESPPSIVTSATSSFASDPNNFIGSYFPGPPASAIVSDYTKPKYSLASSASSGSGSYTSTPVYYPGREEDHTYRMRDTTSQGYEDDESNSSVEDNDFMIGGSGAYQPAPIPASPPSHHYHTLRENDGTNRFLPYGRSDSSGTAFSYGPIGKSHASSHSVFGKKRSYGSSTSSHHHGTGSLDRIIPYSYTPLSYGDYSSN